MKKYPVVCKNNLKHQLKIKNHNCVQHENGIVLTF